MVVSIKGAYVLTLGHILAPRVFLSPQLAAGHQISDHQTMNILQTAQVKVFASFLPTDHRAGDRW